MTQRKHEWLYPVDGYTAFDADLKRLRKKFPKVDSDVESARAFLETNAGVSEWPENVAVAGGKGKAWKLRLKNSSKNAGKRDGFRLVYVIHEGFVVPARMFDKSEESDLPKKDLATAMEMLVASAKAHAARRKTSP